MDQRLRFKPPKFQSAKMLEHTALRHFLTLKEWAKTTEKWDLIKSTKIFAFNQQNEGEKLL